LKIIPEVLLISELFMFGWILAGAYPEIFRGGFELFFVWTEKLGVGGLEFFFLKP